MAVIIRKGQYYGTGDVAMYSTAPIGTIMAFAGSTVPDTYLLCDGTSYEISKYPDLYAAIGTTYGQVDDTHFNVPDLRETVLVGVGTRASGVATHDTYTLGQFKDDQLQQHRHYRFSNDSNGSAYAGTGGTGAWTPTASSGDYGSEIGHISVGRVGSTTHGKQMGVNYIIKYKLHPNSSSSGDPESNTDLDYWIGTRAEWMALSAPKKAEYAGMIVAFTDEAQAGFVMDSEVVQGSENPVSGNAVYEAINAQPAVQTEIASIITSGTAVTYLPSGSSIKLRKLSEYHYQIYFEALRFTANCDGGYAHVASFPSSLIGGKVLIGTCGGAFVDMNSNQTYSMYLSQNNATSPILITVRTPSIVTGTTYVLDGPVELHVR